MKLAVETHHIFGPQAPEQHHLLVQHCTAASEVGTQRVVFDPVPACADAETQTPLGKDLHLGCLFRNQSRLTLRGHQDSSDESDPLRDSSQIPEQHEHLVEFVLIIVRTGQ